MKNNIEVLDCTLRDGGYYNNWDFSLDLVRDYIKSISISGVKYLELGLTKRIFLPLLKILGTRLK